MRKEGLKTWLAGFFLVMLLLTVLSRAAAAVTVPGVITEEAKRGTLTYRFMGQGTVVEEKVRAVTVLSGLRIGEIFAKEGQSVEKGDALFSYTEESIRKNLEKEEQELKKLLLSYEEARQAADTGDSQEEQAVLTREQAEYTLEQAEQRLETRKEELWEQAEKELSGLLEEQEKLLDSWEEKLWEAEDTRKRKKAEYEKQSKEKNKLEALLSNYKEAVEGTDKEKKENSRRDLIKLYFGSDYDNYVYRKKEAERAVEVARESLYDTDDYRQAERNLEAAKEALEFLTIEETRLMEAMELYEEKKEEQSLYQLLADKLAIDEEAIVSAKDAWDRAESEVLKLKSQKEKELERLEEKIEEAQEKTEAMEDDSYDYEKELRAEEEAIGAAEFALKQAESGVGLAKEGRQEAKEAGSFRIRSLQLDIQEKEREQRELKELLENHGEIKSELDGVVVKQQLEEGLLTSGQEQYLLTVDICSFQAQVAAKDCEQFQPGDEIVLSRNQKKETLSIGGFSAEDADGNRVITVDLPKEEAFSLGSVWNFTAEKTSGGYEQKLPIQALRKDNAGYYILIIEEKPGILGTETYAKRANVELLDKDDNFVAVQGSFSREDRIVISSSRNIEGGDQVRPEQ